MGAVGVVVVILVGMGILVSPEGCEVRGVWMVLCASGSGSQGNKQVCRYQNHGRLTEEQALWIIQMGTEVLKSEPNLLELNA